MHTVVTCRVCALADVCSTAPGFPCAPICSREHGTPVCERALARRNPRRPRLTPAFHKKNASKCHTQKLDDKYWTRMHIGDSGNNFPAQCRGRYPCGSAQRSLRRSSCAGVSRPLSPLVSGCLVCVVACCPVFPLTAKTVQRKNKKVKNKTTLNTDFRTQF